MVKKACRPVVFTLLHEHEHGRASRGACTYDKRLGSPKKEFYKNLFAPAPHGGLTVCAVVGLCLVFARTSKSHSSFYHSISISTFLVVVVVVFCFARTDSTGTVFALICQSCA